jgi:hypothetical protein
METSGVFRIDPGSLDGHYGDQVLEVIVPYTEAKVTARILGRVRTLTAGLNARIRLLAIHTIPYPLPFACPEAVHAHLVGHLVELASQCDLPVTPEVVLARNREEGFRYALRPGSTVLVGTRKQFFRTSEERLARSLARDGHNVALVHID